MITPPTVVLLSPACRNRGECRCVREFACSRVIHDEPGIPGAFLVGSARTELLSREDLRVFSWADSLLYFEEKNWARGTKCAAFARIWLLKLQSSEIKCGSWSNEE